MSAGLNGGWGRTPIRAAKTVLLMKMRKKEIGDSTLKRHLVAFRKFSEYVRAEFGITDSAKFLPSHLEQFGAFLSGSCSSSHAQTCVSACNSVMSEISYGKWDSVSPAKSTATRRRTVRTEPHRYIDPDQIIEQISGTLPARTVAIIGVAAHFGLRIREAICLDITASIKEVRKSGAIDVQYGTKSGRGREVQRLVPATTAGRAWISYCKSFVGPRHSLIPAGMKRDTLEAQIEREAQPILQQLFSMKIHELRHEYAARRYKEITGHYSPVNCITHGFPLADRSLDRRARDIITLELGHSRPQIVSTYIGKYPRRSTHDSKN